nr:uncharacterized protein LOC126054425 [Helicoverpa armigera]XP_049696037.1 uncharacterized protein LOC126054425 [Helicoverpa armigera]
MRQQEVERSGATPRQPQSIPVESQVLALVRWEMAAFQARFSDLEGRVLRSPLAVPKPQVAQRASYAAAVSAPPPRRGPPSRSQMPQRRSGRRGLRCHPQHRSRRQHQWRDAPKPTTSSAPTSPSTQSEWQVVGEKKKRRRAANAARRKAQRQRRKERAVAAQLRAPKTAAVMLTLLVKRTRIVPRRAR